METKETRTSTPVNEVENKSRKTLTLALLSFGLLSGLAIIYRFLKSRKKKVVEEVACCSSK